MIRGNDIFFGALVVSPPTVTPWRLLQMLRLCGSVLLLLMDDFSCGAAYFHWRKAFSGRLSIQGKRFHPAHQ